MTTTENLYCLIIAGGKGRRLWPESTTEMPKQFIDFFGCGSTMLQTTYNRYRTFIPANHILISTNAQYAHLVHEQLPDVPKEHILAEPIWRNTAPSVAWGAHRIFYFNNNANIIIAPADQQIIDVEAFAKDVARGNDFVTHNDSVLTLGVKPTRPEPGYGYLQMKDEKSEGIYSIQSFIEKPEREFAQMFMDSGEFYWNTGIYMAKASYLLDKFREILPPVLRNLDIEKLSVDDENAIVAEQFSRYPNISIEKGIIEKTEDANIMHCNFGWADLGTWHSFYEAEKVGGEGNEELGENMIDNVVLDSDVILDNSHNNIIKVPRGHLAVINGLDGYIVVEKGNILLICPKEDSSALIRKYSAEVAIR